MAPRLDWQNFTSKSLAVIKLCCRNNQKKPRAQARKKEPFQSFALQCAVLQKSTVSGGDSLDYNEFVLAMKAAKPLDANKQQNGEIKLFFFEIYF